MTDIYIVDDHTLVVEGIARIVEDSGRARVAGKFYDLASCRTALTENCEGVMLLDVELPDGNGVDFCADAARDYPRLGIVMLTCYKEFNIARHALHNGALGYVLKNSDPEEIFAAIETVGRGERFLCEQIDTLLDEKKDEPVIWLTKREKEILGHMADGLTTREISERVISGVEGVRYHRKNLMFKFGARNMVQLIRRAVEMKLI